MRTTLFDFNVKNILNIIWAAWFSVAASTNLGEFLGWFKILPETFTFKSGNLHFIVETFAPTHGLPTNVSISLFTLIFLFEYFVAYNFIKALFKSENLNFAYQLGICLFGFFMVSDEIFIQYQVQNKHLLLLIAMLASTRMSKEEKH